MNDVRMQANSISTEPRIVNRIRIFSVNQMFLDTLVFIYLNFSIPKWSVRFDEE